MAVGALAALVVWALATDDVRVWPVRNTLAYRALTTWWAATGGPPDERGGRVTGTVRDDAGRPLAGARVLLTAWDGATSSARSDAAGRFSVDAAPARTYTAVASAPGYEATLLRSSRDVIELVLRRAAAPPPLEPARGVTLGPAERVESSAPLPAQAVRRRLRFDSAGRPSQPAFYHTPDVPHEPPLPPSRRFPLLLVVYPGPAEEWESASVPLAAAGYAVVATGPAYSFEPERDVDELQRILRLAQDDMFPEANAERVAVLAGSYSGLHVLRLLQREHGNPAIKAAVLMGAPTDLFDMRQRLEDKSFIPPFGLDQALVALGFPDREALRYWRYSGAYHVRRGMPPALLIHSRSDDVVPYQQSELLARTLSEEGVPHELHLLDGGSHYLLSEERDARAMHDLTLRFLRERLGA